jgi:hypothetical protein
VRPTGVGACGCGGAIGAAAGPGPGQGALPGLHRDHPRVQRTPQATHARGVPGQLTAHGAKGGPVYLILFYFFFTFSYHPRVQRPPQATHARGVPGR